METLSKEQKADRIMDLAGVPKSDFDRCRGNFTRLDDAELDRRIAGLLEAKKGVEEWRKTWRKPPLG